VDLITFHEIADGSLHLLWFGLGLIIAIGTVRFVLAVSTNFAVAVVIVAAVCRFWLAVTITRTASQ